MGQYYQPVNLDKQEFLESWSYDNGAKLMEHSWVENDFVAAAEYLLSPTGSWHKTRVVWAGDYGTEGLFLEELANLEEYNDGNPFTGLQPHDNLYKFSSRNFIEVTPTASFIRELKYIVNHTKKQYVDRNKSVEDASDEDDGVIHPLPILTSNGNGCGGGDYCTPSNYQQEFVGLWAGDVISMEIEAPGNDYVEIFPNFNEAY